jgi:hypothetical protein
MLETSRLVIYIMIELANWPIDKKYIEFPGRLIMDTIQPATLSFPNI